MTTKAKEIKPTENVKIENEDCNLFMSGLVTLPFMSFDCWNLHDCVLLY